MPSPEPDVQAPMHVVAAALLRPSPQGPRVLLARRAAHAHQGGRWEFPGGKVEPGEDARAALAREDSAVFMLSQRAGVRAVVFELLPRVGGGVVFYC